VGAPLSEGKFALGGLALFAAGLFIGLPLLYHPPQADEFLGLGPHGWIAVGTFVLAIVTLFLGLVGLQQIRAARDDAKSNRTLRRLTDMISIRYWTLFSRGFELPARPD
jgi:hypothetical protein